MSTSEKPGYLRPTSRVPVAGNLTLLQFLSTVFIGLSTLPGNMVRPMWQVEPPKQPNWPTNWMAFGILNFVPRNNYVGVRENGTTFIQGQKPMEITTSFYGENAMQIAELVADGFQIQQNLDALNKANIGFTGCSAINNVPEFVNERWLARLTMQVSLLVQTQYNYPILPFLSANGDIHYMKGDEEHLLWWDTTQNRGV